MMNGNFRRCATCNRDAKLYRPYGEFLRSSRIHCARHVPDWRWYVPMIEDVDGSVWGYTSVPYGAIQRWESFPDKPTPYWLLYGTLTLLILLAQAV